jgi:hypothetical protein
MDDGLIQILVIAFFVIISMMDGAARKKRKEEAGRAEVGRGEGTGDGAERFANRTQAATETETSEGMVPDQLWEEIAALARGEPSPSARRVPPPQLPEVESRSVPMGVPEPEETRLGPGHKHVEQHDHVEWAEDDEPAYPVASVPEEMRPARTVSGSLRTSVPPLPTRTDPRALSKRAESLPVAELEEEPAQVRRPSDKGRGVRRTLTHGGHKSVRQAIILSEVLGPPVALRDSDHEPPG